MNDINLFDNEAPEDVPAAPVVAEPELTEVINISKYVVTLNGVQTNPGATGFATEADLETFNRSMIREVTPDAKPAPVDQ